MVGDRGTGGGAGWRPHTHNHAPPKGNTLLHPPTQINVPLIPLLAMLTICKDCREGVIVSEEVMLRDILAIRSINSG